MNYVNRNKIADNHSYKSFGTKFLRIANSALPPPVPLWPRAALLWAARREATPTSAASTAAMTGHDGWKS